MQIDIRDHRAVADCVPVPFRATPNVGRALKPEGIILHDTAGDLAGTGSVVWLCDRAAKASAHVVIDRAGRITQLAPFNVQTWHAGKSNWQGRPNVNGFAIGIEIVNPGRMVAHAGGYSNDAAWPARGVKVPAAMDVRRARTREHGDGYWLSYTPAQIDAVTALCRALREAYDVHFIGTHWMISPGRKVDTNPLFPRDQGRRAVFDARRYALIDDAPDAGLSDFEVRAIQQRLKDLGYYEVGLVDGQMQSNVAAAFAAFQRDNGLPVSGVYDAATRAALAVAQPRIVSDARAQTTADDLRAAGSRTIAQADRAGLVGRIMQWLGLGAGAGVAADQSGVLPLDAAQEVIETAQRARSIWSSFSDIASGIVHHPAAPFIAAGLLVGGFIVVRSVASIVAARVEDRRRGAHRGR